MASLIAQKLSRSVGWLALAQVVRRLSGLVVTALLARMLAPSDFGLVALASLATQLLGTVTEMGLTSALVQRQESDETDFSTGFWLAIGSSVAFGLLGLALANQIGAIFHEPRIVPLFRVMLLTLPISAMGQLPDAILQRKLDFKTISKVDWISGVGSGIVGVVAALSGLGVWALVLQLISASLLATILKSIFLRWRPRFVFRMPTARRLVAYGSSLVGLGLVNFATVNVDNALIGARISAAALGYYMLAFNLVLLPSNNVGGLVGRVMFPALASMQSDRQLFLRAYASMLRVVAVVTFPLVVGLGVTAPLAVFAIYGPQWEQTIRLLEILAFVGVLQSVNVSGVAYSAIGKPQILLAWAIVSLAVMTAGFAIGSRWGVEGVAWSYLIVSPIVCLPPHLIVNRLIGMRQLDFARIVGVPLVAALMMGAVVLLVRNIGAVARIPGIGQLVLVSGLGGITYAGLLLTFAYLSGARKAPLTWITRQHITLNSADAQQAGA
jgi:PST family polysaccharide transporter